MQINFNTIDSTLRQIRDDLLAAATRADATVIQFEINLVGLLNPGVPEADIRRFARLLAGDRPSIWSGDYRIASMSGEPEGYMAYHLLLEYGEAEQVLGPLRVLIPALQRTLAMHAAIRDTEIGSEPPDDPGRDPIEAWADNLLSLGRLRQHPLVYTTELPLELECWGEGIVGLEIGDRTERIGYKDDDFVQRVQTMLNKNPSLSVLPGIIRASAYLITWMLDQPVVRKE